MDFQSNFRVNLQILGQPCEFYATVRNRRSTVTVKLSHLDMGGVQPLRRREAQDVGRVRQQRVQAGVQLQARPAAPPRLGVDVKVILTPRCIFCMENH